jgi:hypothetical protein
MSSVPVRRQQPQQGWQSAWRLHTLPLVQVWLLLLLPPPLGQTKV